MVVLFSKSKNRLYLIDGQISRHEVFVRVDEKAYCLY
jgi:hypothetical protein